MQERTEGAHQFIEIHPPDQTIVFDAGFAGSGQPVWFILRSSLVGLGRRECATRSGPDCRNVCKPAATDVGFLDKDASLGPDGWLGVWHDDRL